MSQLSSPSSQERMIQEQLVKRGIADARVLDAMRQVPREHFLPDHIREHAHADRAAPIGHGQTISQPYIVALMCEHLQVEASHRVLEIGTGSGYHAAVVSRLAGQVYTIERIKALLDQAFERVLSLEIRNVHFRYGDGMAGWPEQAPFDRLIVTAGAPELPRNLLLEQLADGGIAVLPAGPQSGQTLLQVRRLGQDLQTTEICGCRFVKLIGEGAWRE